MENDLIKKRLGEEIKNSGIKIDIDEMIYAISLLLTGTSDFITLSTAS
mgnify:CR=1 FL=1